MPQFNGNIRPIQAAKQQEDCSSEPEQLQEEQYCYILDLPNELLNHISMLVDETDISAWRLTCQAFFSACDPEAIYKYKCMTLLPHLFHLGLSPVFSPTMSDLKWKDRWALVQHHPLHLQDLPDTVEATVDQATKRIHTNNDGQYNNLFTNKPFLTTNSDLLAKLSGSETKKNKRKETEKGDTKKRDQLLFRGVEYFEMEVISNTVTRDRCTCIAITQFFTEIEFLGWNRSSIAYHSDDGKIFTKTVRLA